MKDKKGSQSSADSIMDTPRFNVVEVEFRNRDSTGTKRKIRIPHGQFSPPLAVHNARKSQWFMWCAGLGVYQEVEGAILSDIEAHHEK